MRCSQVCLRDAFKTSQPSEYRRSPWAEWSLQRRIRLLATLKRSGDIAFLLAMLSLGSPVLLSVALLVKLTSPGPVFFVQKRIGPCFQRFG